MSSANKVATFTFLSCLLSLVVLIGCLLTMANQQNKQSLAAETKLIESGMRAQNETLVKFVSDYSLWTDFYAGLNNKDEAWMMTNTATSVFASNVVDLAVMFDGRSEPAFAWDISTGETSDLSIVDKKLISLVKDYVATVPNLELSYKADYMTLNGKPALVAYSRVVPTDKSALLPNDPKPAFAAAYYLTDDRMAEIGGAFFIKDLKISKHAYANSIPISDKNMANIGHLNWTPARPGTATLFQFVLPLSLFALCLFTLSVFLTLQARRQANRLLESEIEARNQAAISNAKALENNKMAQLGSLTTTVAHEIRNPLGSVRTSAYVLRKKLSKMNVDGDELLLRIDKGVQRCDDIIAQLTDFTRTREVDRHNVKFDDWIVKIVSKQAEAIPAHIAVECDLGLPQQVVSINPNRLQRALINILNNAVEAMSSHTLAPDKLSKIIVATRNLSHSVEISVTDNGPGIAEDIQDKIMQPMFTTKSFRTGLGLSASQNILERHGGSISFENAQSGGAIFKLVLPLRDEESSKQHLNKVA